MITKKGAEIMEYMEIHFKIGNQEQKIDIKVHEDDLMLKDPYILYNLEGQNNGMYNDETPKPQYKNQEHQRQYMEMLQEFEKNKNKILGCFLYYLMDTNQPETIEFNNFTAVFY